MVWLTCFLLLSAHASFATRTGSPNYGASGHSAHRLTVAGCTPASSQSSPAPAEQVGPHRYRIGQVVIDTAERWARVPCQVNMRRGMIEFMAVASEGKLHESVLLARAEPLHIHLALLLLGLDPGVGARSHGDLEPPHGPGVEAWVEWPGPASRLRRARLEELAWDLHAGRPMPPVQWIFTGAMAPTHRPPIEEERSVVATYRDPGAVLTNPLPTGADDSTYKVNERLVPPVGTPMTLVLRPVNPDGNQHGGTETRRGM